MKNSKEAVKSTLGLCCDAIRNNKGKIIVISVILIICIGIAFFVNYTTQSPYAHLDYDKYITINPQEPTTETAVTVTNEEVENEIAKQAKTSEKKTQGVVKKGDVVIVSYSGKVNGHSYEGSTDDNMKIVVGSGKNPEFEKAVLGEKTGEIVKTSIDFPGDYAYERIAGKTVDFEIYIDSILKDTPEKSNDKEYKSAIREKLTREKEKQAKDNAVDSFWASLVSSAEMKEYPKDLLRKEAHNSLDLYRCYAKAHNMKWDDFLGEYLKTDEKTLNNMLTNQAKDTVKEKIITYKFAKQKHIKVSDAQYESWKKDYLSGLGQTKQSMEKDYGIPFEEYEKLADLKSMALTDYVKDAIAE